jgi:hypothetical protein
MADPTPTTPASTPAAAPPDAVAAKPPVVPAHHPLKGLRKGRLFLEREANKLKVRKKRPGRR